MEKQELIIKVLNTLDLIEIKGKQNIQLMYGLIAGLQEELEEDSKKAK